MWLTCRLELTPVAFIAEAMTLVLFNSVLRDGHCKSVLSNNIDYRFAVFTNPKLLGIMF